MKALLARPPLLLAALFLALNLVGLTRSPVVWFDEVTLNDPAKELAFHGRLTSSVFAGSAGFERGYFWQPPGQALVQAAVYEGFGFGLWQTRVPVVVFGAAALVMLYDLALSLLCSPPAALFAVLLFALDPKFTQSTRSGRMDAQCLFLALLGTALYLRRSRREGPREGYHLSALSGLAIGLAGITHPVALSWSLAIGALILVFEKSKVRHLLAFALPAALPPALWIGYALAASKLDLFVAQFLTHGEGHLAVGGPLDRLAAEILRYGREYLLTPLLLVTYLCGLLWMLLARRYPRETRAKILILFSATFFFNTFFMTKGLGFYFLHPVTILAISAGALLAELLPGRLRRPLARREQAALAGAGLLLLSLLAGGIGGRYLSLLYQWRARDYGQVEAAVRKSIPPGSVVWGPAEVWYAVEETGSTLRMVGVPDPGVHDYIVLRPGSDLPLPRGARRVLRFGQPLPPVLGSLRRASADYTFEIWTW